MAGERVRLFVALELPGPVRDGLARWVHELPGFEPRLRAVRPEGLHVTLCFLGALPVAQVEAVSGACSRVRGMVASELALGAALWLPRRHPRVLAVELEDPHEELVTLQGVLSDALVAARAFTPEARSFLPHVTVARVRRDAGARGDARVRGRELEPPPRARFDGEYVTLYRSHLGGAGARYETLHRVALSRG